VATDQSAYDIRFDWGEQGLAALLPFSEVVVIVDVLSFSTCVDVGLSRGGIIYPARSSTHAEELAMLQNAAVAGSRGERYSLSPRSFLGIASGDRVVLPSPNGGTLSALTGTHPTFTSCLRNAQAVAMAASQLGKAIAVIGAGEEWAEGEKRFAVEDLLGAGAVVAALNGSVSPEAAVARAAFDTLKTRLEPTLLECVSGRELIGRGHAGDIVLASPLNVSASIPFLQEGAYVNAGGK